jgi:hypothetical protein
LTQYLSAMGRFHNYSFGNIMLIARQKPDATNVAGLRTWNSRGRFVKRGEKGVMILAPMIGHKKAGIVAEAIEDAKQSQSQLYGFRVVYVFDIGQTGGCRRDLRAVDGIQARPHRSDSRGGKIHWQRISCTHRPSWGNRRIFCYSI